MKIRRMNPDGYLTSSLAPLTMEGGGGLEEMLTGHKPVGISESRNISAMRAGCFFFI